LQNKLNCAPRREACVETQTPTSSTTEEKGTRGYKTNIQTGDFFYRSFEAIDLTLFRLGGAACARTDFVLL